MSWPESWDDSSMAARSSLAGCRCPNAAWRWSRRNRMTGIVDPAGGEPDFHPGNRLDGGGMEVSRAARCRPGQPLPRHDCGTEAGSRAGTVISGPSSGGAVLGPTREAVDALDILGRAARIAHAVDDSPEHLAELRDEVIATLALVDDPSGTDLVAGCRRATYPGRLTWKPTVM